MQNLTYIYGIKPLQHIHRWDNPPDDFVLDMTGSKKWKLIIVPDNEDIEEHALVQHTKSLFKEHNIHTLDRTTEPNEVHTYIKRILNIIHWYQSLQYQYISDTPPQYHFLIISNSALLLVILSTALSHLNIHGSNMSNRNSMRFINIISRSSSSFKILRTTIQELYSEYLPLIVPFPSYLQEIKENN